MPVFDDFGHDFSTPTSDAGALQLADRLDRLLCSLYIYIYIYLSIGQWNFTCSLLPFLQHIEAACNECDIYQHIQAMVVFHHMHLQPSQLDHGKSTAGFWHITCCM